jgi:hypothetical protein
MLLLVLCFNPIIRYDLGCAREEEETGRRGAKGLRDFGWTDDGFRGHTWARFSLFCCFFAVQGWIDDNGTAQKAMGWGCLLGWRAWEGGMMIGLLYLSI